MKKIICIGAVYIDAILSVDHYPGEDEKLRASQLTRRRGGNCPNSLEVLQQLVDDKLDLHLLTVLPNPMSEATRFIADSLSDVSLRGCLHRSDKKEAPSSYIIKSQATGSRTIVNHNELREMTFEEFQQLFSEELLPWLNCDPGELLFHFEGRIPDVTLHCMQYLRDVHWGPRSVKISVEVEKPGREGLKKLAAVADMVFYSKSWAQAEGFRTARQCLEEQVKHTRPRALLCCTWGADGAVAVKKVEGIYHEFQHRDAWKPRQQKLVIDTVGAGDTFIAGMLYAAIRHPDDWNLAKKLAFATELAGRKVLQDGFGGLGIQMREFEGFL